MAGLNLPKQELLAQVVITSRARREQGVIKLAPYHTNVCKFSQLCGFQLFAP